MIYFYMYIMYTYREVPLPPVVLLRPLHVPPPGVAQVLDALKARGKNNNKTFPTFFLKKTRHSLYPEPQPRHPSAAPGLLRPHPGEPSANLALLFHRDLAWRNKKIKTGFHEKKCEYI